MREVAAQAFRRHALFDELAGLAADEARCHDIRAERVRDVRDVEAFAARRVLHGRCAHDLALREIRQRIALVDGGVEVQYENQSVHSS